MKTEYTHEQKLSYYKKRARDFSLTLPQRLFAQGFLDGADDSSHAYKRDTIEFMKTEIPRIEKENMTFRNATFNGYGQGSLSALKDMVAKAEKKG